MPCAYRLAKQLLPLHSVFPCRIQHTCLDEETECARDSVKKVLEVYEGLLARMPESNKATLQNQLQSFILIFSAAATLLVWMEALLPLGIVAGMLCVMENAQYIFSPSLFLCVISTSAVFTILFRR